MHASGADERTARAVSLSVVCLGITAFVTQILSLREFLNLFSGNELTLGIILGNWLLLTGLGGLLGRYADRMRRRVGLMALFQIGIAILPAIGIGAIRMVRRLIPAGLMIGIGDAFWTSLVVLLPFCLISGFLLAWFSGLVSARRDWRQIGDVYVLDSIGGIAGGLLFSLVLVHFLEPFAIATLLLVLNLLAAGFLAYASGGRGVAASLGVVLVASLVVLARSDLEVETGRALFPGLNVLSQKATPYGSLTVTGQGSEITVYQNGIPLGSTGDLAAAEEIVHYALSQHPDPKRVLLLSGGLVGAHREVQKYPVERIDYVELDPALLDLAATIQGAGSDPRVHAIAADPRRYVRSAHGVYDAVLMAAPDPSSAQLNRLYTAEFFTDVRGALRAGGVFSFSLTGAENYAGPEVRELASAIYRSLTAAFPNVLVIPGARQFFVASERSLDLDIAARLEKRGIETRTMRREYLAAKLTEDRLAAARSALSADVAPNRDFHPISYYVHLRYWLSQFGSGMLLPSLLIGALLILIVGLLAGSAKREVPAALCASGFSGMGLEVILLIAFQVNYGSVYQDLARIITGFMVGAAAGAFWSARSRSDTSRLLLQQDALLAGIAFLLIPLLPLLRETEIPLAPTLLFPLLNAAVGFAVGAQFPPAARLIFGTVEETAGKLYAFDLLGACLGALVVSAFCIPLMGLLATAGLLGGVKLLSAAALRLRRDAPAAAPSTPLVPAGSAIFSFGIVLLVLLAIGMTILAEETSGGIYAFSLAPWYLWALVAFLAIGILWAMGTIPLLPIAGRLRWIYFFLFALPAFYPIFRCYFRVPYLFCHVCPRKCVFGFMRPYLIPAALIMNLEKRYWCYHACPIGTLHDCQARVCKKSRRAPKILRAVAFAVLGFTAVGYFKIQWDLDHQPGVAFDWYTFFFGNAFAASVTVLAIAAALILLGGFLRRTFCETLCPVGTFSDLVLKGEHRS